MPDQRRLSSIRHRGLVALALCLSTAAVFAAPAASTQSTSQPAAHHRRIIYTPPANGAPGGTIGGGSRGDGEHLPFPQLYAPTDHVGLTTRAQPTLYFMMPEATKNKVSITLVDQETKETIALPAPLDGVSTGLQRFDVSSTGKSLRPGAVYVWSVSVRSTQGGPAHNAYVGAFIRYVEPAPALKADLAGKDAEEQASVFADNHVWFDTIAAEVEAVNAQPDDDSLKQALRDTLDAGGKHS